MTYSILFVVFLTLFVAFITLKHFSLLENVEVYKRVRSKGDAKVVKYARIAKKSTENIDFGALVIFTMRRSIHLVAHIIATVAKSVENNARKVTGAMAYSKEEVSMREGSSFLKEVSIHKKGLDTDRIKRETTLTSE